MLATHIKARKIFLAFSKLCKFLFGFMQDFERDKG
jgi:hypothetical protein